MKSSTLDFMIKIIASIAAVVQFTAGVQILKESVTPSLKELLGNLWIMAAMGFGVSYAATGDLWATAIGYLICANVIGLTRITGNECERFTWGFGCLLGMDVDEALTSLKKSAPSMYVEVVDEFSTFRIPNRMQLKKNETNKIIAYKQQ